MNRPHHDTDDLFEARLRRTLHAAAERKLAELDAAEATETAGTTAGTTTGTTTGTAIEARFERETAWAAAGPQRTRRIHRSDHDGRVLVELDESAGASLTATISYPGLGPDPRLVSIGWALTGTDGTRTEHRAIIPIVADDDGAPLRYGLGSASGCTAVELEQPEVLAPDAALRLDEARATLSLTLYSSATEHWVRYASSAACEPSVADLVTAQLT